MSDFLQIEDEVINGTPKYNITSNGDGTSSITLANEVVHSGTPLNRANLGNIGNILGYNTLQFTQSSTGDNVSQFIDGNYAVGNVVGNSLGLNIINKGARPISVSSKEAQFYSSDVYRIEFPDEVTKIEARNDNSWGIIGQLKGSNDEVNWTTISGLSSSHTLINREYKYYQNFGEGTSFIRNPHYELWTTSFTYDFPTLKDRQVLNVYISLPKESSNNTLNGKQIDTVLKSGHYYELMFDEPNDRFIAYETRV